MIDKFVLLTAKRIHGRQTKSKVDASRVSAWQAVDRKARSARSRLAFVWISINRSMFLEQSVVLWAIRKEPCDLRGCFMGWEGRCQVGETEASIYRVESAERVKRWRSEWCWMRSFVKTGRWSDGEQWVEDADSASEESVEVIAKSRMWFWCRFENKIYVLITATENRK